MSQQELSAATGIERKRISRIEAGLALYQQEIHPLAEALDISVQWLTGQPEEEKLTEQDRTTLEDFRTFPRKYRDLVNAQVAAIKAFKATEED